MFTRKPERDYRAVMGMVLLVILAARAAEKKQNRLSVGMAHVGSLRSWRLVVKRTTLPL
jgi:poly-gamma-glutamate capsule biosynthesis protein CapA/YwtB (metallophosphatase superfamily)